MDEREYRHLCDDTLRAIDAAFEEVDPDLAESTLSQGALSIVYAGGLKAIVSPQPPVRQMWLAFRDRAWHFDWDGARWLDDKGGGVDLYRKLEEITRTQAKVEIRIS